MNPGKTFYAAKLFDRVKNVRHAIIPTAATNRLEKNVKSDKSAVAKLSGEALDRAGFDSEDESVCQIEKLN
ncbi:MAG: hypothetical protein LBO05_00205 [Deltaproteobacteria bacterium]|nr:hypothetical protein [Deltaproteobacteria bacterium]